MWNRDTGGDILGIHMRPVGAILVAGILMLGVATAQDRPSFEVASIRPIANGGYGEKHQGIKVDGQIGDFGNVSLTDLAAYAFHVRTFQIIGPQAMNARFSIMAKLPDGATPDQAPEMIAQLLVDRFQMKFHKQTQELPVYALITGPNGAKVVAAPADYEYKPADRSQKLALSMDTYATMVQQYFDKPVVNETGLDGKYLFDRQQVRYNSARIQQALAQYRSSSNAVNPPPATPDPSGSPIFQILRDLGLKVELRKEQLPVVIIDRIEMKPTEQ